VTRPRLRNETAAMKTGGISTALYFSLLSVCTAAESWSCTYPGFTPNRPPVTVAFVARDGKLISGPFGVPIYTLVEDNQYSLIGLEHYSQFDKIKGAIRIFSSTVIIEKTFGKFIYTVSEIGSEPSTRTGQCSKDQ
jgi:hypothetical protein